MDRASKKDIGVGSQGKRDGSGSMVDIDKKKIEENLFSRTTTKPAILKSGA
jgi:hypothetical protein